MSTTRLLIAALSAASLCACGGTTGEHATEGAGTGGGETTHGHTGGGTSDAAAAPRVSIGFTIADEGIEPASDAPRQHLRLVVTTAGASEPRTIDLGTQQGSSSEDTNGVEGALAGVRYWWAGAGVEFVVVRSGTTLTVRRREVDEGDAEHEATPGPWQDAGTATVPADAQITVTPIQ